MTFPLCSKCVANLNQEVCSHSDEERAIVGTWPTPELKEALKLGYKIVDIFEVLHYKEKSDKIFTECINMWLKTNQETSGWPSWCHTKEERDK